MITIGYFPGKQTATPSKPKSSGGSSSESSGGGSSSPTPYNTSPALRQDIREAREAANTARGVTSRSGGGGSSTTGSATASVDLATAPKTPGGVSGTSAKSTNPFSTTASASIVSGKPAGYALAKQQYIRDILDQQAAVRQQKADEEFLKRPGPYGMAPASISAAPLKTYEPTVRGGIDKAKDYLSKKSATLEQKSSTMRAQGKGGAGSVAVAAGAFGVGFAAGAVGLVSALAHPVRTAKGLYQTAKDPMGSGARAGEAFATRPVQTVGETAGTFAAGYGISKLIGKGVQQLRKTKTAEVKSFQADKAHIKTKQVVPGSDAVQKSTIEQTSKARVQVGSKTYAVKGSGRAKAITTDTGRSVTVGKTKLGVTDVTKISKGKTTYKPGGSRFVTEAQQTGDKIKSATVQQTAVKTGKLTYGRQQVVSTSKGAKVLQADRGISVTTKTAKGTKTVKPMDVETWQYKTISKTTKTQQVSKATSKIRAIKPLSPTDAEKILKIKRPTGASVTTQTRTKGLEITRQTMDTKTPAVYTKTSSTQVVKGRTVAASIPKKPVVKPLVTKAAKTAQSAAWDLKTTTGKMLTSKKASTTTGYRPVQPRLQDAWPKSPSGLKPETVIKPATKIRVTSVSDLQTALYNAAKSAAKLTYVYAPVRGATALGTGAAAAAVVSSKLPSAITVKPLERDLTSPLDKLKPGVETKPRTEPSSYTIPIPKVGPDVKITVVPDVTYPPATYPGQVMVPTPVVPVTGIPGLPLEPPLPPGVPRSSMPPAGGVDSWSRALLKKTKQPKGYTPSATALAFGIKGKASATGSKTGLGLRPIVVPKSKKKQKFRF